MKRTLFPELIIATCLMILTAERSSAEEMKQSVTESEVGHAIEELNAAFAANDVAKYFSHVDADITVITPSNPYRVEGIREDRDEFERGLKSGAGRVGYFQEMQPKIQLFGDVAVVTYFSRGSYGRKVRRRRAITKKPTSFTKRTENGKSYTFMSRQPHDYGVRGAENIVCKPLTSSRWKDFERLLVPADAQHA